MKRKLGRVSDTCGCMTVTYCHHASMDRMHRQSRLASSSEHGIRSIRYNASSTLEQTQLEERDSVRRTHLQHVRNPSHCGRSACSTIFPGTCRSDEVSPTQMSNPLQRTTNTAGERKRRRVCLTPSSAPVNRNSICSSASVPAMAGASHTLRSVPLCFTLVLSRRDDSRNRRSASTEEQADSHDGDEA